jgi:hypothetical protein
MCPSGPMKQLERALVSKSGMRVEELQLPGVVCIHEHRQHFAAKQACQHFDMHEEIGARGEPSRAVERESSTRHDPMHVRMVVSVEPHVCSTAVMPILTPRRLGSAAMARVVLAAAFMSRS